MESFRYLLKNASFASAPTSKLKLCWGRQINLITNKPSVAIFPFLTRLNHPKPDYLLSNPTEVKTNMKHGFGRVGSHDMRGETTTEDSVLTLMACLDI